LTPLYLLYQVDYYRRVDEQNRNKPKRFLTVRELVEAAENSK